MTTLALLLIMVGGLLIWAGITNNSIMGLLGSALVKPSSKAKGNGGQQ